MKVVVLTGAGISAESGLATFRDADGLWENHRPEDVATPEAFAEDRALVQRFYDERRAVLARVAPNAAHRALAELENLIGDDLFLVTQNIDDLHEQAGSRRVHHMHGELRAAWCVSCDSRMPWTGTLADEPPCPRCGVAALRPDVVWFGEMPYGMDDIHRALFTCDLFVSIGTSGVVYPAAAFVDYAIAGGSDTLELNLERAANSDFRVSRQGLASELVPAWVAELGAGVGG
ncbi:NAD-dependent deacylase [Nocardioides marmoriginsengisoli]|uniref:NAD-dependent protein deacylase n=1 Tax=Nocardioides marmoriginsengisoli TaxID=661483 RepID=A0A3N0CAT8_9ACTN|nr:NAD-dependent deacylase [Nocardioides marmoriginsengisoli]RNL60577.1 NAD-dependent deacylase [Nocardioides marmoriginsengisoli]